MFSIETLAEKISSIHNREDLLHVIADASDNDLQHALRILSLTVDSMAACLREQSDSGSAPLPTGVSRTNKPRLRKKPLRQPDIMPLPQEYELTSEEYNMLLMLVCETFFLPEPAGSEHLLDMLELYGTDPMTVETLSLSAKSADIMKGTLRSFNSAVNRERLSASSELPEHWKMTREEPCRMDSPAGSFLSIFRLENVEEGTKPNLRDVWKVNPDNISQNPGSGFASYLLDLILYYQKHPDRLEALTAEKE